MKPIILRLKTLAASERRITAEILDCIREIERLKIHLEMGYPSLMEFLVRECGYSETSALRRMDAARVVNVIPEIREDLKNGSLNLSQVSIVAQSVRQKEKMGEKVSIETKRELMKAVQHKRTFEVQKIAAQMLDLPILQTEKLKIQADESVRIEFSLTKAEMEILNKAKELLGHIKPGLSTRELVVLMAERVVRAKDPAREVRKRNKKGAFEEASRFEKTLAGPRNGDVVNSDSSRELKVRDSLAELRLENSTLASKLENPLASRLENPIASKLENSLASKRENLLASKWRNPTAPTRVTAAVRRQVFQRDQGCQWVSRVTGKKCGSRHLLEIDHKTSKWAGGSDQIENLELKCRVHNRWKYRLETRVCAVPSAP